MRKDLVATTKTAYYTSLFLISNFLLILNFSANGQGFQSLQLKSGYVLPIRPDFPKQAHPTVGITYQLHWPSKDSNLRWAAAMGNPIILGGLSIEEHGNKSLGWSVSSHIGLEYSIFKLDKIAANLQFGLGYAWMSNPYDAIQNRENIVYGAHSNLLAYLALQGLFRMNSELDLLVGFQLSHYSNGHHATPNVGVNIPGFSMGLRKSIETKRERSSEIKPIIQDPFFMHVELRFGLGLTERYVQGPKLPVYNYGISFLKRYKPTATVKVGIDYIYNVSQYHFLLHTYTAPGEEKKQSERLLLFGGHEFLFGQIGLLTELGYYLTDHAERNNIIGTRFGLNYYPIHPFNHTRHLISLGIYVRAYLAEADYLEFSISYQF